MRSSRPRLALTLFLLTCAVPLEANEIQETNYPIKSVPFTSVKIGEGVLGTRLETNRDVTIPYAFKKCEETGRIDNFAKAGKLMQGDFVGLRFNDSDVFKVIEGASYSLSTFPDPKLEKYLDDLITKIAAAQEEDGYLYTVRTLVPKSPPGGGPTRWSNLRVSHELYNAGHLYEAAVAHWQATGKKTLLNVAVKNADFIDSIFGEGLRSEAPGHQEIEIGLVKLYRATGEKRYLTLAQFFLDQRGQPGGRKLYGKYSQDHLPVVQQEEAVGHAVRAVYMYSGMADVAAITGDRDYIRAIDAIWDNVASKKLYLTGGIGAIHKGEAFGKNFELPNDTAYGETCAAIGNAQWNHRMFLLHGESKYIDVLERLIYNGVLSGISLEGNRFFYSNPLASDGVYQFNQGADSRKSWFDCSCCPVNIARFMPSIAGYLYARTDNNIVVNLYAQSKANIELEGQTVALQQHTNYPWDGKIKITVSPERPEAFGIQLRIPGWAQEEPLPGGLYHFAKPSDKRFGLRINGKSVEAKVVKGYVTLDRAWKEGDVIQLDLPMPVRRVLCDERVVANRRRVAIQRGPLVYCLEATDHAGEVASLVLPDDASLSVKHQSDLLGGVITVHGKAVRSTAQRKQGGNAKTAVDSVEITAVPYFAWNHRKKGPMAVWLLRGR